jgi:hypothetical protein
MAPFEQFWGLGSAMGCGPVERSVVFLGWNAFLHLMGAGLPNTCMPVHTLGTFHCAVWYSQGLISLED